MTKNELFTQWLPVLHPPQILIPYSFQQHMGPGTPPSQQSKQGVLMQTLVGPHASFSMAWVSIRLSDCK